MKYLILLLFPLSAMADPANQTTSTEASYSNTIQSINPMSFGGGDVLPSMSTVGYKNATCANNQFILDAVNTDSSLTGARSNGVGNQGMAIRATVIVPFGDNGRCREMQDIIARDARLIAQHNQGLSTHKFCWLAADDLKARNQYADDEYYDEYEAMRKCRKVFTMSGVSHKVQ